MTENRDRITTEALILSIDAAEGIARAKDEARELAGQIDWYLTNATDDCLVEMVRMSFADPAAGNRHLLPKMQIEAMRRGLKLPIS